MPGSLFNKAAGSSLQLYYKRDSGTGVFMCILRNFKSILFYRTPPVTTSSKSRCFRPKLVFEVGACIVNQLIEH